MNAFIRRGLGAAVLSAPLTALAHHAEGYATPQTIAAGLLSGFAHPAIEVGQAAFLVALGAYCARWPGGVRTILGFGAGSVLGVLLAAAGVLLPAERLLPLLLLGIAAVLAYRSPAAPTALGWRVAAMVTALAGVVHGQAAIEPVVGASSGAFVAYAAAMLCTQILIVLLARGAITQLLPADARIRRRAWGAASAASAVAAVVVALEPGLSLV